MCVGQSETHYWQLLKLILLNTNTLLQTHFKRCTPDGTCFAINSTKKCPFLFISNYSFLFISKQVLWQRVRSKKRRVEKVFKKNNAHSVRGLIINKRLTNIILIDSTTVFARSFNFYLYRAEFLQNSEIKETPSCLSLFILAIDKPIYHNKSSLI